MGSARRVDLQIYAGDPYVPGSGGRAASFLTFEQIEFNADGRFEIIASPRTHPGNWIENPHDAKRVLARQIFSDRERETASELHIHRVDHEGTLKPALTEVALADRFRKAAASLTSHVEVWPEMVRTTTSPAASPIASRCHSTPRRQEACRAGGCATARGICPTTRRSSYRRGLRAQLSRHPTRRSVVLIARVESHWRPRSTWFGGNYQGIQLADLWFSSLEYANRQASLTGDQGRGADGTYQFVISARDPGVRNWLDTTGRERGVILLRFDGTTEIVCDPAHYPTATKVRLSKLATHLSAGTPMVTSDQRRVEIATRRRHVQRRFSN